MRTIMESVLVRRDQFSITAQGIVHRPTGATFTPYSGDPFSGTERLGELNSKHPSENNFNTDDVRRMMRVLWFEYVATHRRLFDLESPEAGTSGDDRG